MLTVLGLWSRETPAQALSWPALRNATYPTSVGTRTLKDGAFEVEAAPGSASKISVRLVDFAAFGDLDGDPEPDAAVVLVSSGGGSGTFVDLVAVLARDGAARPVARVQLGDRVLVREVRIEDRHILVRLRTRGATDPLSLVTREISRRYVLAGDTLTLSDESTADVPTPPADSFVYRPERIALSPGVSRAIQGTLPAGQIASYVVGGEAGQVLELTVRSVFNNAILSVSGLSDGLPLVSRSEYAVQRTIALPASQDYAVRVVNVAGQSLPFTLEAKLNAAGPTPAPTLRPTEAPLPSRTPQPSVPPAGGALADHALSALSDPAARAADSRPPVWGVAVAVPSSGSVYVANADVQVPTASVVKVLILLTVLERARQEQRPATEQELALLWPKITESDNDATSALWDDLGGGQAVASYVRSIGVTGFTPDPGSSWGVSFVSARAMATVLGKLLAGDILDPASRALALRMLDGVIPEQRWGVTAGLDAATDQVGLKNGWYPGDEGWRVNSVGIIRPKAGAPYAIAIVTDARPTWREGIEAIESISAQVNLQLHAAQH